MLCRTSILGAVLCFAPAAHAAEPPALTLFENVRVFDGKSDTLSASMNVLVRGNTIEKISKDPIAIDGGPSAKIIAAVGVRSCRASSTRIGMRCLCGPLRHSCSWMT